MPDTATIPLPAAGATAPAPTETIGTVSPVRPLRILIVASEAPPVRGGVARFVQVLRDGLAARGHTVDLLSYPEVPRVSVGEVRLSGLLFQLPALGRRLKGYDLVHLHGVAPTFSELFLLYLRLRRVRPPLIYTHHFEMDLRPAGPLNALYNQLHRRLTDGATTVVATSHEYAARFADRVNTLTIEPGVDADRFARDAGGDANASNAKTGPFTVLFVGQFRGYKGVPVLLKAMAAVPGARLVVAGRGPEEARYRALAARLGVAAEFHISPSDAEVSDLFRHAHVIALPSVSQMEAFGIVLVEGMAAGCVPVASDLPGVREVVGRIGFTFPVGQAEKLAAVLRRLRDNPELVAEIGPRARHRAAQYSWDRFLDRHERLFLNVTIAASLSRAARTVAARTVALQEFVAHVACHFGAMRADVLLDGRGDDAPYGPWTVGATGAGNAADPLPASYDAVARFSRATGEHVCVAHDRMPGPLAGLTPLDASLLCVPLTAGGQTFGTLLVARTESFDARDLDDLAHLARQISPTLREWMTTGASRGTATPLAAPRPRRAAPMERTAI